MGYLVKSYFSTFGYILGSSFNTLELSRKPESYQCPADEMSMSFAFRNVPLSLQVAYLQIKCHIVSFLGGGLCVSTGSTLFLNRLISGLSWQLHNVLFLGFPKLHTNWIFYLISFLRAGAVWILGLF